MTTSVLPPLLTTGGLAVAAARNYADSIAAALDASGLLAITVPREHGGTHASHDPADWKYHHAGNYLLNHVYPPNHGRV